MSAALPFRSITIITTHDRCREDDTNHLPPAAAAPMTGTKPATSGSIAAARAMDLHHIRLGLANLTKIAFNIARNTNIRTIRPSEHPRET